MNPYRQLVSDYERLQKQSQKKFSVSSRRLSSSTGSPKALIFSPHPDDECIVGGLALRLTREAKWNVLNVAVTLGSKKQRQPARLRELKNACTCLGFGLIVPGPNGLKDINLLSRKHDPKHWTRAITSITDILKQHRPRVVFLPHGQDWHETHIGTHHLVMDALRKMPDSFECHLVETEFWGQMASPNLLTEISPNDLADMVAALSLHVGEVKRNPYHLRLPAWMIDNVRRAEIIGGPGTTAPDFTFATIYRLQKWKRGRLIPALKRGKFLSRSMNPGLLFT